MLLTSQGRAGTGTRCPAERWIGPGSRGVGAAADLQGPGRRCAAVACRGVGQRELPRGRGAGAILLRTDASRLVGRATGPIEAGQNAALAEARPLCVSVGGCEQSEDSRGRGAYPKPQTAARETLTIRWHPALCHPALCHPALCHPALCHPALWHSALWHSAPTNLNVGVAHLIYDAFGRLFRLREPSRCESAYRSRPIHCQLAAI